MARSTTWRCARQPLADAIARAVFAIDPSLTLFAPNDSALAQALQSDRAACDPRSFCRSKLPARRNARSPLATGCIAARSRGRGRTRSADAAGESGARDRRQRCRSKGRDNLHSRRQSGIGRLCTGTAGQAFERGDRHRRPSSLTTWTYLTTSWSAASVRSTPP